MASTLTIADAAREVRRLFPSGKACCVSCKRRVAVTWNERLCRPCLHGMVMRENPGTSCAVDRLVQRTKRTLDETARPELDPAVLAGCSDGMEWPNYEGDA